MVAGDGRGAIAIAIAQRLLASRPSHLTQGHPTPRPGEARSGRGPEEPKLSVQGTISAYARVSVLVSMSVQRSLSVGLYGGVSLRARGVRVLGWCERAKCACKRLVRVCTRACVRVLVLGSVCEGSLVCVKLS